MLKRVNLIDLAVEIIIDNGNNKHCLKIMKFDNNTRNDKGDKIIASKMINKLISTSSIIKSITYDKNKLPVCKLPSMLTSLKKKKMIPIIKINNICY